MQTFTDQTWYAVPKNFDVFEANESVPYPFIWVCRVCGETSTIKYGMENPSCSRHAVLCWNTQPLDRRDLFQLIKGRLESQKVRLSLSRKGKDRWDY